MSSPAGVEMAPSLAWSTQHAIAFLPSLMPRVAEAAAQGNGRDAGLRDESAEAFQRQQIWGLCVSDLSLLLRLPLVEFYSHALYNKSLHRLIAAFLQQCTGIWAELEGRERAAWAPRPEEDGDEDDEKSQGASQLSAAANANREQLEVLRGLAKRVLLVYVRICSCDVTTAPLTSGAPTPAWLTGLFFSTSFAASPLFSAGSLLDLVSFYSAIAPAAHRPLLAFILQQVNARLPYAFTTGMQHAIGIIVSTLQAQCRAIHAPYVTNSSAVKKARCRTEDLKQLIRNLTSLLWSLYCVCKLRPELLRLLVGPGKVSSSSSSAPPAASSSSPPFLALLTTLYTLTPLLLLQELGVKYAQLSAQPELLSLRTGCMKFLQLIQHSLILPAMGVRVSKKGDRHQVTWSEPKQQGGKAVTTAQATTSSTLPPPLTLVTACDVFFDSIKLLHDTVQDGAATKDALCYLPLSMKNLVSFNTASTQNALLKRYNEYYHLDSVLSFLHKQKDEGTAGATLGTKRIERLLQILVQIDAPLVKQRIGWPIPKPVASSASYDGPAPSTMPLSRSVSTKNQPDLSLQISLLSDLFGPTYSTDFLRQVLVEFNGSTDEATQAILEEKLPVYLQTVKDKKSYRSGDQMDNSKLARPDGVMSRQSSTGSGLLDEPVDDDDEAISHISMDVDDGGFEEFLKRTGRVSKETLQAQGKGKVHASAAMLLNSFDKSDAMLLAKRINAQYEDDYDDAYDSFETFAVDGATPLELDERASSTNLYDHRGAEAGGDGGDEPDGSAYQRTGKYAPPQRQGMRGGRGGAASAGTRGGRNDNYDNVAVPRNFMADGSSGPASGSSVDVRDQWRRDEERKEVYVATIKAQKAQQLAPSKRTAEQAADYEHGLRYGLIQPIVPPGSQQNNQKGGARQQQQQQPQQQQQQQQQPQTQRGRGENRGGDVRNDNRNDGGRSNEHSQPTRGGFSMRGGRGGGASGSDARGRGNNDAAPSLSASAASFEPRSQPAPQQQQRPVSAQQPHNAPAPSQQRQRVPTQWDDDSGDEGGNNNGGGGGGDSRPSGEGGEPNSRSQDLRDRARKEQNKSRVGNHNRKAGALKKMGIKF